MKALSSSGTVTENSLPADPAAALLGQESRVTESVARVTAPCRRRRRPGTVTRSLSLSVAGTVPGRHGLCFGQSKIARQYVGLPNLSTATVLFNGYDIKSVSLPI